MTEEQRFELTRIEESFARCTVAPTYSVYAPEEFILPMEDGIGLRTILYRPETEEPVPAILVRTCYPKNDYIYRATAMEYARRGFAYLYQYCRGTGGSGGEWEPNVNERRDGKVTADWLCAQPWVKNAGYSGCSYLALTGWAIADILPEKFKTMYLTHYGTFRFVSAYKDGLFRHDILTGWTMENAGFPVTADYLTSCRYRPHTAVDVDLWGRRVPWYQDYITSTNADDAYWNEGIWQLLKEIPGRVKVPIYLGEAWYDHHLGSAIETWLSLSPETRSKSTLLIGAWTHNFEPCMEDRTAEHLENNDILRCFDWFYDILVRGIQPEGAVKLYLSGADRWITRPQLREEHAPLRRFYLDRECLLADRPTKTGIVSFIYDPEDPVMSHGAESLLYTREGVGSLRQPPVGNRSDVVSFVSQPLEEGLNIVGRIKVRLRVATDADDTAFVFKLMEVTPEGKAYNIRTGITTLGYRNGSDHRVPYVPGEPVDIVIDSWDVAYALAKGSRLRLDVTSSDFPQYAIHSNYAGCWSEQDKTRPARQTIFLAESSVELPLEC